MTYGHAERNLAVIRELEAETKQLLAGLPRLDEEQRAWLDQVDEEGGAIPSWAA